MFIPYFFINNKFVTLVKCIKRSERQVGEEEEYFIANNFIILNLPINDKVNVNLFPF